LDEWFLFLKTGEIAEDSKAPGLPEARERLRRDRMSKEEQAEYDAHMEALRYQKSVIQTSLIEGEAKGREEGEAKGRAEGEAIRAKLKAELQAKDVELQAKDIALDTTQKLTEQQAALIADLKRQLAEKK
jgi:predicted transposase YdaD